MRFIDRAGQRFDRLTALNRADNLYGRHTAWLCRCDCGNTTVVSGNSLQQGNVKSCGCLGYETKQNMHTKHGDCGTRLYDIYHNMKGRCYDKKDTRYKYYGGRGIQICDEWLGEDGYLTFKKWSFSNDYSGNLLIERKDNDGNYSPENCKWATIKEQANNTRQNRRFTYDGETKTIAEWSEKVNIAYPCLRKRLMLRGWNIEKALTTPSMKGVSCNV